MQGWVRYFPPLWAVMTPSIGRLGMNCTGTRYELAGPHKSTCGFLRGVSNVALASCWGVITQFARTYGW